MMCAIVFVGGFLTAVVIATVEWLRLPAFGGHVFVSVLTAAGVLLAGFTGPRIVVQGAFDLCGFRVTGCTVVNEFITPARRLATIGSIPGRTR